jgi:actin-related protein 8
MDISTQHLIPPLLAAAAASPSALADTSTVTKFVTLEPNDFENKTSSGAATAAVTPDASSAPVAMEGVESSAVPTPAEPVKADDPAPAPAVTLPKIYPGGVPIDIRFEASKLPLDVAIFNSIRAGGGMDKIKKFLQVVLVVGGGALTPGMVHALESRLVILIRSGISLADRDVLYFDI